MTRIIGIASGKGGVGKTTTAINLGCALTRFGRDTVVVDGNLSTPHVALHLGSVSLASTLNDALLGRKAITDTAYLHPSGLKVIPAGISLNDYRGASMARLRDALLGLAGATETVLLDTAGGVGEEASSGIKAADEIILVTTPDMLAVTDAMKTSAIAQESGVAIGGVIISRATGDKAELDKANIEALLGCPTLGIIPEDPSVKRALAMKQPVVHSHPDSPAAIAFKRIAASMLGQSYEPSVRREEPDAIAQLLRKLGF
jgi:septum site-determining protein MinD